MIETHAATDDRTLPHPTRRNAHWSVFQFLLRIFFTLRFRYRARGTEHVPKSGGGLVLANHLSALDPLLVGLPLSRPVSYLARDTLFPVPFLGWVLRNTYVMPINRDATSSGTIRGAVRRMKHGFLVGIFPEGTRSRDGALGVLKPGFIALVRRGDVPVLPVGIAGANHALPRGSLWPRQQRISVVFGKPILPEEFAEFLKRGREAEMVAFVRERILACQQAAENWQRLEDG